MIINNIKERINLLELIECESLNLMQYKDDNKIRYAYKIIEFKKRRFYIIDNYYNEIELVTEGHYKTILKYEIKRNGTGTNGTK